VPFCHVIGLHIFSPVPDRDSELERGRADVRFVFGGGSPVYVFIRNSAPPFWRASPSRYFRGGNRLTAFVVGAFSLQARHHSGAASPFPVLWRLSPRRGAIYFIGFPRRKTRHRNARIPRPWIGASLAPRQHDRGRYCGVNRIPPVIRHLRRHRGAGCADFWVYGEKKLAMSNEREDLTQRRGGRRVVVSKHRVSH
jgi:hypothetical protein